MLPAIATADTTPAVAEAGREEAAALLEAATPATEAATSAGTATGRP